MTAGRGSGGAGVSGQKRRSPGADTPEELLRQAREAEVRARLEEAKRRREEAAKGRSSTSGKTSEVEEEASQAVEAAPDLCQATQLEDLSGFSDLCQAAQSADPPGPSERLLPVLRPTAVPTLAAWGQEKELREEGLPEAVLRGAPWEEGPGIRRSRDGRRKKRRRLFPICAVFVLVFSVLLGSSVQGVSPYYERAAREGSLSGGGWAENAAGDSAGLGEASGDGSDAGRMCLRINSEPEFYDGHSLGNLEVENPAGNPCDLSVELRLKGRERPVFRSGAIRPGQHLRSARLTRQLGPGEYPATAYFTLYDPLTRRVVGSAGLDITIHVLHDVDRSR